MKRIENRIQMQLRIDQILHSKLKVISELEHRFLNGQIEYFLSRAVQSYESEHGPINVSDNPDN